ncbi:MAG TPA: crossover junction endodeoxyribonuclease RuvC [Candidatus Limnocylindrales bacterium]|jgi:crossover junction endodeoxyribonuclease RuvC
MIVLGIDPGTAALGYGVIELQAGRLRAIDFGCLVTSADLPLGERLVAIHARVAGLISDHAPVLIGVERLFFSRNVQTAFAVGQARGVVLLAAAQAQIPVREATPNEVKLAVAGSGSADKLQVQQMVAAILGLKDLPEPDDAADALAMAICVAHRERPAAAGDAPVDREKAGILDRSSIEPITRGRTPYERAVREALARERR